MNNPFETLGPIQFGLFLVFTVIYVPVKLWIIVFFPLWFVLLMAACVLLGLTITNIWERFDK